MRIISGSCGNNRATKRAVQNRIIGKFWSTLASSLSIATIIKVRHRCNKDQLESNQFVGRYYQIQN